MSIKYKNIADMYKDKALFKVTEVMEKSSWRELIIFVYYIIYIYI